MYIIFHLDVVNLDLPSVRASIFPARHALYELAPSMHANSFALRWIIRLFCHIAHDLRFVSHVAMWVTIRERTGEHQGGSAREAKILIARIVRLNHERYSLSENL